MDEKVSSFRERLISAMRAKNIKQIDLAKATNATRGTISHYITGRSLPAVDIMHKIALVLNVNEAWLMGYDAPMDRINHAVEFLNEEDKYILRLFHSLDNNDKRQAIKYIKDFLLSETKYQHKKETTA